MYDSNNREYESPWVYKTARIKARERILHIK